MLSCRFDQKKNNKLLEKMHTGHMRESGRGEPPTKKEVLECRILKILNTVFSLLKKLRSGQSQHLRT